MRRGSCGRRGIAFLCSCLFLITVPSGAEPDPAKRTRLAFSTVLCREPDAVEMAKTEAYFAARSDRANEAVQQVLWALMAGAEFRFNH